MPLAFQPNESHPMVDALLRTRVPRWEELNRAIDARDDMLDFALKLSGYDRDLALTSYFQNALEQLQLVRHIAGWRGPIGRMLDFASGYGRLTRLLVHEGVAKEVTVSDILEGGMEFQAEQFGVKTLLSTTRPEDFAARETYDLIFVVSLFTHLPAATFTRWLRRLAELLTPEGLLIFTVHDESLAPEPFEGGIRFDSSSESRVLEGSDYGSTWVTESYVREQVASVAPGAACVRMPRALAEWQDVYVVSPAPLPEAVPRAIPKGFIEEFVVTDEGVRLTGWATLVTGPVDRIEVRVEDELVASVGHFGPREDVAAMLDSPEALLSSWWLIVPHERIRSFRYQVVTVSAFSREGAERILFLGTVEARDGQKLRELTESLQHQLEIRTRDVAVLQHEVAVALHQRGERDAQMAAMRASRFWRVRDWWFGVKRALGLTRQP